MEELNVKKVAERKVVIDPVGRYDGRSWDTAWETATCLNLYLQTSPWMISESQEYHAVDVADE